MDEHRSDFSIDDNDGTVTFNKGDANQAVNWDLLGNSGTSTMMMNEWGSPYRVDIREYPDRIEMIYKQTSNITLTIHPSPPPAERVFKIVFSCVDGKWNKSEPIFGEINRAQAEHYIFND